MIDDYLEFKLIGNLWKIINKRGCFSFEQMVKGNNFNKWCFIPVSRCSGDWKKNINNDYTLNYNEVTPLKKVYTDDDGLEVRESVNYPPIELYMQSYDNGGLTVQVSSATPIVEIGNVAQDMAGVFIVNKVTNIVLAFCILPESFKVYNFISFLYDGYLLEINNPVMVDKPKLPDITKLDTNLTITLDKDSYYIDDIISFNGVLKSSDGELVKGAEVLFNEKRYITNDKGEFSDTVKALLNLTLDFIYGGSPAYNECSQSVSVQVSKIPVSFVGSASSTNVYVGETVTISGTLKTSSGSPLGNVKIIDGAGQVQATTGATGAWSFTSVEDTVGTSGWSLYPDLDWNKYNTPENVDIQITIRKKDTVLTCTADKTSVTVGETVTLTATVKSDGVNVNEGQVDFGDGVLVDVSNGTAVKTFTKQTPTVLTVTPSYKGTSTYTPATASSLTLTWIEEQVTPEISISASTLIGEVGDDLPITLSSNLKNTALTVLLDDAEVADSVTTDNTGNAVFNYNCNGAGDVNVKVKYLYGTNVYYSNILNLEDCLVYDTMTSESDRWVRTSDIIVNIDSEGTKFSTNSNSEQQYRLPSKYFTPPYTIEFDWVDGGGNQKMALELWPDATYSGDTFWYGSHWDSGANKFLISTYPSSTSSSKTEVNITRDINPNDHLKFIVEPNNVKLYQNGELILNKHQGKTCDTQYFCFYTNKNRIQKVKNLKIKSQ
ncbi:MAG: hypothetical protein ACI39B_07955 [Methanobrevibacter smithii]|jgi:hypothetical protein|nr:MAG TPA: Ig-like domain protein [Caudoviricetes sp.]